MHRHPYFDLFLHDDEELLPYLGRRVLERVTLHEWPLSCVQQLTLGDGRRLIYKAQAGPPWNPAFTRTPGPAYCRRRARSTVRTAIPPR